jgi:hypothetical protein
VIQACTHRNRVGNLDSTLSPPDQQPLAKKYFYPVIYARNHTSALLYWPLQKYGALDKFPGTFKYLAWRMDMLTRRSNYHPLLLWVSVWMMRLLAMPECLAAMRRKPQMYRAKIDAFPKKIEKLC